MFYIHYSWKKKYLFLALAPSWSILCHLIAWGCKTDTTNNHKHIFSAKHWQKSHLCLCHLLKDHRELFESLHTVSWYKQISSCAISGPVCQPGTDTCDQWSGSCSVILWSCDLHLCLSLTRSLFRPQLLNNKQCLPRLNLYFSDKNRRMTCPLWPWQL